MARRDGFTINPSWQVLLRDLGLRPVDILRRARLPEDLFQQPQASLSTEEYFRLWEGIEEEANDPALPLRIGEALSVESFDPAVFAAMCSPNLNLALQRIATYKRLICPMVLHVDVGKSATTLEVEWGESTTAPPKTLIGMEVVFFVQLSRMATRHRIEPLKVKAPLALEPKQDYIEYFGIPVQRGKRPFLSFAAADAARPFLTANDAMWKSFEPHLQQRLSELDTAASMAERVHTVLLEMLPSGSASIEAVAQKLGTSGRTLQRRLQQEDLNFQSVLNNTREELARHYLKNSAMTGAEISFLLGFEDPNSFFRAFHNWTGETPEQVRIALQA